MEASTKFKTVDEYLLTVPKHVKEVLMELGKAIQQAVPQAEHIISYNMPAFKLEGFLVSYAAWKEHIGFYPRMKAFEKELSAYEGSKGTVKFPLGAPLPLDLIIRMVKARVEENKGKAKGKKKGKKF